MKKLRLACVAAAAACLSASALAQSGAVLPPGIGGASRGSAVPRPLIPDPGTFRGHSGGWYDGGFHHGPGHPGEHHGHWNHGHGGSYGSWGYGAYLVPWAYSGWDGSYDDYALTEPSADMFGFYGAGGDVTEVNGTAVYHYDRSYPYEYYRGAPAASVTVHRLSEPRCEMQVVPDGKGKGTATVRICRQ